MPVILAAVSAGTDASGTMVRCKLSAVWEVQLHDTSSMRQAASRSSGPAVVEPSTVGKSAVIWARSFAASGAAGVWPQPARIKPTASGRRIFDRPVGNLEVIIPYLHFS